MRSAWCLLLALPLTGCLYPEARVQAAPGLDHASGHSATATKAKDGAPAVTRRGPLPFEIPSVWILRDPDGMLMSGHATARSPLPWWQRFPTDLLIDLWPADVTIATTAMVEPRPITPRSADDITAEARAHGYAP